MVTLNPVLRKKFTANSDVNVVIIPVGRVAKHVVRFTTNFLGNPELMHILMFANPVNVSTTLTAVNTMNPSPLKVFP